MKLRNKKTGEIKEVIVGGYPISGKTKMWECSEMDANEETGYKSLGSYTSLTELNEEWEDAPEEPKEYWCIDWTEPSGIYKTKQENSWDDFNKEIGNCFDTQEEAEKAVEKLKAWKILMDMGFKIDGIRYRNNRNYIEWSISQKVRDDHFMSEAFNNALHLLFGGEE